MSQGRTVTIGGQSILTVAWAFVSLLLAALFRFGDTGAVLEVETFLDLWFWAWWFVAFLAPGLLLAGLFVLFFLLMALLALALGGRDNVQFEWHTGDDRDSPGGRNAFDDRQPDDQADVTLDEDEWRTGDRLDRPEESEDRSGE